MFIGRTASAHLSYALLKKILRTTRQCLVYGRHAGLWPFEKISPLLVPSALTYRSEPAQSRHALEEKAIVLLSGDHAGLANPPACTSVVSPSPFAIAMALLG